MIVPMKKVCVVVRQQDANSCVGKLRHLGLLHVEHQQVPTGGDIASLQEDAVIINDALLIISQKELGKVSQATGIESFQDWKHLVRHIIDTQKRIEHLEEYSRRLAENIRYWEAWGDFSPVKINELRQKGIFARLYQIPEKQLNEIPEDIFVHKVFSVGGIAHCLVVGRKDFSLTFKEINLPKIGLCEMQQRSSEDKKVLDSLKQEINGLARFRNTLVGTKKSLQSQLQFQQVLRGMGYAEELAYVAGYIPFDAVDKLSELAKKENWGILITAPSEEDNAPVLLRNPKWVSIINPLFKLMEIVPGYHELDVSPLFLLFLSLFFGMIIGDAGYGAVYFLLTFLGKRKFGKKVNPVREPCSLTADFSNGVKDNRVFFLFYLFSFCAIIWGLLTGTVFGQEWYLAKGFKALVPLLNQTKFLMAFCFFLGALQLSLAHGWQAIIKLPSLKALADVGFICLLWAGFFLAKMFIVGDQFPSFAKWLIWLGILLIIFFSSPSKNILKSAAKGLGVLALGLTGNFGDVVSYIRLFAVGLAGVAVADSVNTLAASVGTNFVARAIILFIGHTINILLGPISVLVHGIRLNILEFSVLHGNVTWGGLAYKPLKS